MTTNPLNVRAKSQNQREKKTPMEKSCPFHQQTCRRKLLKKTHMIYTK